LLLVLQQVIDSIPPCPHPEKLIASIQAETARFFPKEAQTRAT